MSRAARDGLPLGPLNSKHDLRGERKQPGRWRQTTTTIGRLGVYLGYFYARKSGKETREGKKNVRQTPKVKGVVLSTPGLNRCFFEKNYLAHLAAVVLGWNPPTGLIDRLMRARRRQYRLKPGRIRIGAPMNSWS